MTPDKKLDTPGMTSAKALPELARNARDIHALAREGAAQEGKLFAELSAAFTSKANGSQP